MNPPHGHLLRYPGEPGPRGSRPGVVLPVLLIDPTAPGTDAIQQVTAVEGTAGGPPAFHEQMGEQGGSHLAGAAHRPTALHRLNRVVFLQARPVADLAVGLLPHGTHLGREFTRQQQVVGIQKLNEASSGSVQPPLTGCTRTGIGLVDHQDRVRVGAGQVLRHGGGVVGGAVVHDHDLDRPIGLGQNAGHGFPQQIRTVVHRNDGAHQLRIAFSGRGHGFSSLHRRAGAAAAGLRSAPGPDESSGCGPARDWDCRPRP